MAGVAVLVGFLVIVFGLAMTLISLFTHGPLWHVRRGASRRSSPPKEGK